MAGGYDRLDVNCSILFTELPLLERPAAAKAAGFDAVELWWPFAVPAPPDKEVDALVRAIGDAGTALVGLNFDAGDMAAGERGLLSQPANSVRFRDNVEVVAGIAEATGCRAFNALYGNRLDGLDAHEQDELAAANLGVAADAVGRLGGVVLVEALNSFDSPEYPLVSTADALSVIEAVRRDTGADNVRFLLDTYHLGRMGEDLRATIATSADRIGHVQVADVPGRGQPGTGELDFTAVFGALAEHGYNGYVGLEYKPVGPSAASFDWINDWTAEVSR